MNSTLGASYAWCRQLTRRKASNFYYSFLVLPQHKRRAMCALYAFLRHTDDLGDDAQPRELRQTALAEWRLSFQRALEGRYDAPLFPALADTVRRYDLDPAHLHDVIDGVEMDLDRCRYETFDELGEYCYKVASAVGLCCVRIWGCTSGAAREPACKCGVAFQLTNILRDLKEDAERERVYLPQEDLRRFGYTVEQLRRGEVNEAFHALMRFEIARAEEFYRAAAELPAWLDPDGRAVFGAMTAIYRGLLEEIKRLDGDVFRHPVRLSAWRKLRIAGRWLLARPQPVGSSLETGTRRP